MKLDGKCFSLMGNSCHNTAYHPGISRMKAIARSYFWWNGLDHAIEIQAKSCLAYEAVKPAPPVAPLHPCLWQEAPWRRIHIDFAEQFMWKMFLIVVDQK